MRPGTPNCPLRVAIIGSGPAAFYTLQHLLLAEGTVAAVDMFERLPAPFGLVRYGVAPDHEKIKTVTAVYAKLAAQPGFRYFGNVEYGRDLSLADLARHYHQVVFCTGAQSDRALDVPGEELSGSHAATEFVAWYNGHPDFAERCFDLSHRRAVVVGVGNVAVDVARILCRTPEELARTDIADHALAALRESRIEEVVLVGRRGPAQAAFTNPEAKELGELEGADAAALPEEVEPDPLTRASLERNPDRTTTRKLEILRGYAAPGRAGTKPRRLLLRFLLSPAEILDDGHRRVGAVRFVRNEICAGSDGELRARPTAHAELIEAGLVLRSVGYRGAPLPGLPFDARGGVVPNEAGRVVTAGESPLPGLFVAGWIKRGPTGVIGTNKPDAAETVRSMIEELAAGRHLTPAQPSPQAVPRLLEERRVRSISYDDWRALDAVEVARGRPAGRPRVKFVERAAFLAALEPSSR
jgi:ferredoxin--NADP+ reductase